MSSVSTAPEPVIDGRGGTILGPRNVCRWSVRTRMSWSRR
jgi:hypothetical protein